MKAFVRVYLVLILLFFVSITSSAQSQYTNQSNETGMPAHGSFLASDIDSVNLANGGLHVQIPFYTGKMRGNFPISLGIRYESKYWNINREIDTDTNGNHTIYYAWQTDTSNASWQWDNDTYTLFSDWGSAGCKAVSCGDGCTSPPASVKYKAHFILRDGHGNAIKFPNRNSIKSVLEGNGSNSCLEYSDVINNNLLVADSAEHDLKLDLTGDDASTEGATFTLSFPNGNTLKTGGILQDSNGNTLTQNSTDSSGWVLDNLGRRTTRSYSIDSNTSGVQYYDSNGNVQTIQLVYTTISGTASFPTTAHFTTTAQPWTLTVLSRINLPNGLFYAFSYDDPDNPGNTNPYGELTKITLPAGGYIKYKWATIQGRDPWDTDPCGCETMTAIDARMLVERRTNDGSSSTDSITTYSYGTGTTTVVDPAGNTSVHTFIGYATTGEVDSPSLESKLEERQGATTNLRVTNKTWDSNQGPVFSGMPIPTNTDGDFAWDVRQGPVNPRVKDVAVTLSDVNLTSTTHTDFSDCYSYTSYTTFSGSTNFTHCRDHASGTTEYDYGASTPSRITTLSYFHNDTTYGSSYLNAHLWDLVQFKRAYAGNGTTLAAETEYRYDTTTLQSAGSTSYSNNTTPSGPRGNQTEVRTHRFASGIDDWPTTYKFFDSLGNLRKVSDPTTLAITDANIHYTSYSFDDSTTATCAPSGLGQLLPTQVTNHLGHRIQTSYYPCTDLVHSTKDENDIAASRNGTVYVYDAMNRTMSITYPDTGSTTFGYSDSLPFTISKTRTAYPNPNVVNTSKYDGLGRVIQTQVTSNPVSPITVDTTYDLMSRVSTVSNPYVATDSTNGSTTTQYDPLGRVTHVTHNPDSSTITNTYFGRATETQDESGITRISQVDALGNLKSVCEVTNQTQMGANNTPLTSCNQDINAGGFITTYDQDVVGNLVAVHQGGLSDRTFTYDSLSHLLSSFNPEAGTTSYTYDTAGNVAVRTRPMPNQTGGLTVTATYGYDALNRETSIAYTNSDSSTNNTPNTTYLYDLSTGWGGITLLNPVGRRVLAANADGSRGDWYSYDPMGRVVTNWQGKSCTGTCGAGGYVLNYGYDLAGQMISNTDGVGHTVSSTYSGGARLTSASSSLFDSTHPATLITNIAYGAFGPISANLGNGITETRTYTNRGWSDSLTASGGSVTHYATPGTVSITVTGAERQPSFAGGSVSLTGTEQSTQVLNQAAVAGSGSVTINGSEQSTQVQIQAATTSTATVTLAGSERVTWVQDGEYCADYEYFMDDFGMWEYGCVDWEPNYDAVYDTGHVTMTANGFSGTVNYGASDTPTTLASGLVTQMTGSSSPVTASSSGASLYLTSKATGASVNYSLTYASATTNTGYFTGSSFSDSGAANMSGGQNATFTTVYDAGTLTITANGHNDSVSWGNGSTTSSIASALVSAINADGSSSVSASSSGAGITLTAKTTGAGTNYSLSSSHTYDTGHFSGASFGGSNGSALSGGANATYNTVYDAGTVTITVNGYTKSASYGQSSTAASVASALASAIAGDSSDPATAAAPSTAANLQSRVAGSTGNSYTLSASSSTSQGANFSSPSFATSPSGSTLTGGVDSGGTTYDAGTYAVTVNGLTKQVTYGSSSTPSTLASAIAAAFNGDSSSTVTATSDSSGVMTFTSKTDGASVNAYSYSVSSATTQSGFSGSSFSASSTSGTLAGGSDQSYVATNYTYALTFKANGNISNGNDSVNGNWTYAYDDFNRLSSAVKNTTSTYSYGYDRYGNRWKQWLDGGGQNLSFQATNNQLASGNGVSYDAAGNVIQDGSSNNFTYDAENRVVSAGGDTYVYDADGRRVAKLIGVNRKDYLFDLSDHIIAELYNGAWDVNSNRVEVFAGGRHLATYNRGKTYFPETDWLGTDRFTVDNAGIMSESCASLPFGDGESCSGPDAESSPDHFTGKERDVETGLDYFGARYYVSNYGRWMSPDWDASAVAVPYADFDDPQSLNLYGYVKNNPNSRIDTDGHDVIFATKKQEDAYNKIASESPSFSNEVQSEKDDHNLTVRVVERGNKVNAEHSGADTTVKRNSDGTIEATIYLENGDPHEGSIEHETGHVVHARTNPTEFFQQAKKSQDPNDPNLKSHNDRPEEKKADEFKDKVEKERHAYKKQQKEKKEQEKRAAQAAKAAKKAEQKH